MPRNPPPPQNSSDYKFITRLWKFNETKLIVSCNEYALTAAAQMETDHLTKSAIKKYWTFVLAYNLNSPEAYLCVLLLHGLFGVFLN